MEHVIAGYIRQVWENSDWLYEGQHGFRLGYLCESQIITVCQDTSDTLDEGARLGVIIIDYWKAFDLVPHDRLLRKIATSGMDSRVVVWIREFLLGHSQRVRVERQLSEEVKSDVRRTSRERFGPTFVPSLCKQYLEEHGIKS
jgi:hypothetical protein